MPSTALCVACYEPALNIRGAANSLPQNSPVQRALAGARAADAPDRHVASSAQPVRRAGVAIDHSSWSHSA